MSGFSNIEDLLQQCGVDFKVVCLCETWLTREPDPVQPLSRDFNMFYSPALRERSRGRASGGLIIYYSRKFFEACVLDISPWWIVCTLKSKGFMSILALVYFKPTLKLEDALDTFQITLGDIRERFHGTPIIICGDFNARLGSLGDISSDLEVQSCLYDLHVSSDTTFNSRGCDLLEFMDFNSFSLLNGRTSSDHPAQLTFVTHNGASTIDLFWCSFDGLDLVSDLKVRNDVLCSSGHFPIILKLHNPGGRQYNLTDRQSLAHRQVLVWNPEKTMHYSNHMSLSPQVSRLQGSVQESFDNICNTIWNAAAALSMWKSIADPCSARPSKPWFDQELRSLKRIAGFDLKACRLNHFTQPHLSIFLQSRQTYRKLVRLKKRDYERSLTADLANIRNQEQFWRTLRTFQKKTPPHKLPLECWEVFYQSFVHHHVSSPRLTFCDASDPFLNKPISYEELESVLIRLPCNKSPGKDGISYEFLKVLPQNWKLYVCVLFNKIFELGVVPNDWHEIVMIMLHKKGPPDNPENYRGIALLSSLLKTFSIILLNRLSTWSDFSGLLPEAQSGFRRGRGCIDNVFTLSSVVQIHLRLPGRRVYAAFIDFRRAFDSIDHQLLWKKLYSQGISAKIIRCLQNLYDGARLQVRSDGRYSQPFDVNSGVLQGEPLSPFLFSAFLADIEEYFRQRGASGINIDGHHDLLLLLYADDLVILSDSPGDLQRKLCILQEYSERNLLEVNTRKSNIICFRRSPRPLDNDGFFYRGKG